MFRFILESKIQDFPRRDLAGKHFLPIVTAKIMILFKNAINTGSFYQGWLILTFIINYFVHPPRCKLHLTFCYFVILSIYLLAVRLICTPVRAGFQKCAAFEGWDLTKYHQMGGCIDDMLME
jgi:hypothetical protein